MITTFLNISAANAVAPVTLPTVFKGDPGPPGEPGPQGPVGPQGQGLLILGTRASAAELPTTANPGDAYIVINNLFVRTAENTWENTGAIRGPKGDTGNPGPAGVNGANGAPGAIGPTGPQGDTGPQGEPGPVGPIGPAGLDGAEGAAGAIGPAGPKGDPGDVGPEGPQGDTGPAGATGLKGDTGDVGPMGPVGPKGDTGTNGTIVPGGKILIVENDPIPDGFFVYHTFDAGGVRFSVIAQGTQGSTISITSGNGDYGTVYTSNTAQQWYADNVAIPGETGLTYTMTVANEGKTIRQVNSNSIQRASVLAKPSLAAYWDFSETGTSFYSKRGQLSNGVPLAPLSGAGFTKEASGPHGSAVLFDGASVLGIPNTDIGPLDVADSQAVTVVAWVRRTTIGSIDAIAGRWREDSAQPSRQYCLFTSLPMYNGSERVCGHVSRLGGATPGFPYSIDYSATSRRVNATEYHMQAFTYSTASGEIISYLDGVADYRGEYSQTAQDGTTIVTKTKNPYPYPDGLNLSSASPFSVGGVELSEGWGNFLDGAIGALAVFKEALTPNEIKQLYLSRKQNLTVPVHSFFYGASGSRTAGDTGFFAYQGATAVDYTENASSTLGVQLAYNAGFEIFALTGAFADVAITYMPIEPIDKPETFSFRAHHNTDVTLNARMVVRIDGQLYATSTMYTAGLGGAANSAGWDAGASIWSTPLTGNWHPITLVPGSTLSINTGVSAPLPAGQLDGLGVFCHDRTSNLRMRDFAITV